MEQPQPAPRPAPKPVPRLPKKKSSSSSNESSEYVITHLSPTSAIHNQHEQVILVFNKALPDNVKFVVIFSGLQSNQQSVAPATKVGSNVLLLKSPDHYPPEETKLTVHHGNHRTKLSTYVRPFVFQSHLQQIKNSLSKVSDPIEFMCSAFHLRQKTTVALDFELEKQFKKNIPPDFTLLTDDSSQRITEVKTYSENPTLLHFAARYNLFKLSLALLECPGGFQALNTANCDGFTPSDLANCCDNQNLAEMLADAQQNPNRVVEDIYEPMHDPHYQAYQGYLNEASDDIYVPMGYAEEEEIYARITGDGCYEDDDNIYENTADSGYDSRADFRDLKPKPDDSPRFRTKQLENQWDSDSRSIQSFSSASSAESNFSAGSGSDYASKPRMPEPRKSLGHIEVKEPIRNIKTRKSMPLLQSPNIGNRKQNEYASRENMSMYSARNYEQGDVPPPPPPKNPNINQY